MPELKKTIEESTMDPTLRANIVATAFKQIQVGVDYKQDRLTRVQKFERMYNNAKRKQLKNRFNITLPILSGYIDTLMSKIDDAPILTFNHDSEADLIPAKKATALWEQDSAEDKGDWQYTDRQVKKMAIFSGRGIMKYYAESDPDYKSNLEAVCYYDFYCEPKGGSKLENHLFLGQQNIFRSKNDLTEGADVGRYEQDEVVRLLRKQNTGDENKTVQDDEKSRFTRQRALGLDPEKNNYTGIDLYNMTEHYMEFNGKRYYLFLNEMAQIAISVIELKKKFESNLYPFRSFATNDDPANFWSKGPCDDVFPIAEGMIIIFNQAMDNIQKRNWGMRAYDSSVFKNPALLQWKPDGLVPAAKGKLKSIREGVYTFETPDNTQITVNMMTFLDNFMGLKTGITNSAQGATEENKAVGVFFGELQQVADRLGLYTKEYKRLWAQIGILYLHGLKEHLSEAQAVKMLGPDGVIWDELIKDEVQDFGITVSGGDSELKLQEIKKQRQLASIEKIITSQVLTQKINPNWLLENILRAGDFPEEEIKRAIDTDNYGNENIMSEAAMAIDTIIQGKKPDKNTGANTAYIQKIMDYAYVNQSKIDDNIYDNLLDFAMAHIPIARDNMIRQAQSIKSSQILQQSLKPQIQPQLQIQPQQVEQPIQQPIQ